MKCDVCGTKVPLGGHECPQCGYKIKRDNVRVFDSTGQTHEHISEQTMRKSYVPPRVNINTARDISSRMKPLKIFLGIIVVFVIVAFVMIPQFMRMQYSDPYENMNFSDILDSGEDQHSIVEKAVEKEKEVLKFMEETQLTEIRTDEYIYEDSYNESINASFSVRGKYNNAMYTITVRNTINGFKKPSIYVYNRSDKSMRLTNKVQINKTILDKVGKYAGIDNLTSKVEPFLSRLKVDEDMDNENYYKYSHDKDTYLYLSEEYLADEEQYYQTISTSLNEDTYDE